MSRHDLPLPTDTVAVVTEHRDSRRSRNPQADHRVTVRRLTPFERGEDVLVFQPQKFSQQPLLRAQ